MKKRYYWLLLFLPCIPILAAWDRFMVPAGTKISDIMISHYPNLLLIQKSLANGQGIPLWSPQILSGYPFSSNPLSSLWYPPAWISLLFPLPLGINLVMGLHVFIGSAGFYYLLRRLNLSDGVATLGGLLFGLLPAGFSHIAAGHFTWVCASAWLPWLLASSFSDTRSTWKAIVFPAGSLGMMMLADLRFAVYGGIFWLAVITYQAVFSSIAGSIHSGIKPFGRAGISLLLAAGISTVVWLPLLEFTNLSTRSLMTIKDALYLSLPPVQLTGLVVPGHPSTIEWIIYPGAACLLLALISVSFLSKRTNLWFWLGFALLCLVWSLGEIIPTNQWLVTLPGFNLLRVPARGLFFLDTALVIAAMIALDHLIKNNPDKAMYLRLGTIFFTVLVILVQIFVTGANPEKNSFLIWHSFCWLIIACLILFFSYRKITARLFLICMGFTAVGDVLISDLNLIEWRTVSETLADGMEEARYVVETNPNFRVFSPSYSIPQQTAASYGIELTDGIDPMQLRSYSDFVRRAVSLSTEGYSVTLPPFKSGDPKLDNAGVEPDAKAFSLLNVRYLVSAFPIKAKGWELVNQTKKSFIYLNRLAPGWAWVEPAFSSELDDNRDVEKIIRSANQITLEADGPGLLVLSEINYPGWQASVDGQPVDVRTAHSVLRSISLSEGHHQVEFRYIPYRVFTGAGISLFAILLCIFISRVKM